jgi:phosphoribosylamine--glycine ligase
VVGGTLASAAVNVLVLGSGGREDALVQALARDSSVTRLVCAPGNAGTIALAEAFPLDPTDAAAAIALATEVGADLVVIGPEAPLVAGVADALRDKGFLVFGPSGAAARIEGSKAYAKDVMRAAGVPTAAAMVFDDDNDCAAYLAGATPPYVVKADGLAAGKGVHVGLDLARAVDFARDVLSTLGGQVVVEEYLDGPELSLFALSDGAAVVPLIPAQDFKRAYDGDEGPNTGGMGAYAPLPWLPVGMVDDITATVLGPVIEEMARRGTPFVGLLYAGIAVTSEGPSVVEFNCRFGDPETEAILPLLETPLAGLLHACADGSLGSAPPLVWRDGSAVTVVVAAEGYPAAPVMGDEVVIDALPDDVTVQHAGTALVDGRVVSAGGRVLAVTAVGPDLASARNTAYLGVASVRLRGAHSRSDVALRAVQGEVRVDG